MQLDQILETEKPILNNSKFTEAEFNLLKYQLEEKDFRALVRLVSAVDPDKWPQAVDALAPLLQD